MAALAPTIAALVTTAMGFANFAKDDAAGQAAIARVRADRVRAGSPIESPPEVVRDALEGPLGPDASDAPALARAGALVIASKESFAQFQYDVALTRLQSAEEALKSCSASPALVELLGDINLLAGQIFEAQGNRGRAIDAFRVVHALDPNRKSLDAGLYRPQIVALYAQAAAKRAPKVHLAVSTLPAGAVITVDAQPMGTAPLDFDLELGKHYIAASSPGFRPSLERVQISRPQAGFQISLVPAAPEDRIRALRQKVVREGASDWGLVAKTIAQLAGLERLTLVRESASGLASGAMEAAVYDAREGHLGAWQVFGAPAESADTRLQWDTSARATAPTGTEDKAHLAAKPIDRGEKRRDAAGAWYGTWWGMSAIACALAGAGVATWLELRDPSRDYSLDHLCINGRCGP